MTISISENTFSMSLIQTQKDVLIKVDCGNQEAEKPIFIRLGDHQKFIVCPCPPDRDIRSSKTWLVSGERLAYLLSRAHALGCVSDNFSAAPILKQVMQQFASTPDEYLQTLNNIVNKLEI